MKCWGYGTLGGIMLAGAVTFTAAAFAQQSGTVTDAQIQSNVLKALAAAPDLGTQNIQTTTVFGTVTLTGNVHNEAMRTEAENLAARADGVKKVVDELTLGDSPATTAEAAPPAGMVLQSDGTYAPADANEAEPAPPAQAQNAPPQPGYPQGPPPDRRPMYQNYAPGAPQGGQQAGIAVTVPAGVALQIRVNRGIDSQHIKPGTPFDGTILNDVASGGVIAIPRGAGVQGVVVDAAKTGALKGRGELALQITGLTMGGQTYPLTSAIWNREGKDKTASTVNHAVGLGAIGALFGAAAGGGAGAAIGAGVGAGLGVAGSASSRRGQIIIPPEAVLNFATAQPLEVKTVSQQEMDRLNYSAGPPQGPLPPGRRRYYGPYGYYYR
jgi:hypothetical protein